VLLSVNLIPARALTTHIAKKMNSLYRKCREKLQINLGTENILHDRRVEKLGLFIVIKTQGGHKCCL